MGARSSFDSGTDIPKSMRRARGVSTSWKSKGRCHSASRPAEVPGFAWTVEAKDKGPLLLGRPAAAWIKMALMVCNNCPVQYECARWAIEVDERWGTWAMPIEELHWLKKRAHGRIIDAAEDLGVPVQVAVRTAHAASV